MTLCLVCGPASALEIHGCLLYEFWWLAFLTYREDMEYEVGELNERAVCG